MYGHETFLSPMSWRYGSDEMRSIWSEMNKRRLWRRIWVALAEAQASFGLVRPEQVEDLRAHADAIDMERAASIEAEIHHDLMAEVRVFAEQCPIGGGIIHLGATSMDVEDNADALRLRQSMDVILHKLERLLAVLADQIERWAETPCMAFTHLQPAEPTTLGYRLAQYGQELALALTELRRARDGIRGKGFKGAVGTAASYVQLLGSPEAALEMERRAMGALQLEPFPITTQVYPRMQDWVAISALAGLAATLYRLAFDVRLLQSPPIGEWAEPFGAKQVGSSAMPFKRNPIHAENMDSLARFVAALPAVAWNNAAHCLLERTLDDSANRRLILPEAFLATDELLIRAIRIVEGLRVRQTAIARNLRQYGVFAASERLLMEAVKAGGDRQRLHEVLREHSIAAWEAIEAGQPNPLKELLCHEPDFLGLLPVERIEGLLDAGDYVGIAPRRAKEVSQCIRQMLILPQSESGDRRNP